ncbi:hypothetical protein AVEN_119627-1, partial [Araneus ventricosus]
EQLPAAPGDQVTPQNLVSSRQAEVKDASRAERGKSLTNPYPNV